MFRYPHLKATLTSCESLLDLVGASKDEVGEGARGKFRLVSFRRGPRVLCTPGASGGEATAVVMRSSSRRPGAASMPGAGGEEPTAAERRPYSRGPGTVHIPGAGGKQRVVSMVSTRGPSSRGPGAVRIPSAGGEGVTLSPGRRWSVPGSDVLPVSAIGRMGTSNAPPLGSQLVRKVPGWRPLGLESGADP